MENKHLRGVWKAMEEYRKPIEFIDIMEEKGSFRLSNASDYSYLYFPIAGVKGLKSAVTPELKGDAKTDQNHFLLQPVSAEDLHNNKSGRNFWCRMEDGSYFSAVGVSAGQQAAKFTGEAEEVTVEAGILWHRVKRVLPKWEMETEVLSFVPIRENMEVMQVSVRNTGEEAKTFTPIGAVPLYARSADNLRDHRHVTSLLHRIYVTGEGVCVQPVLSFDERGHKVNHTLYYVAGAGEKGEKPESFYPLTETFIGEGGSYETPEAVVRNLPGFAPGTCVDGYEAMGGIRFAKTTVAPGERVVFLLFLGLEEAEETSDGGLIKSAGKITDRITREYGTTQQIQRVLEESIEYWDKESNIAFRTGDRIFDQYMKWVCFQPVLRRVYGCSFLPYHDYGKGGRGWRDLWQDQLALLMMNPKQVGTMLLHHYGGVRMDGSNATIIGNRQGEFIADRNNITRVWMDHGLWPFMTTHLYLHQTGDLDLLLREAPYFKDKQALRGTGTDTFYKEAEGTLQKTREGTVYYGTVLEHILLHNITIFYETGEHNHMRLRGADWNDALDMAADRGESVAFTAAYAGNLEELAGLLRYIKEEKQIRSVELLEEMLPLLADERSLYEDTAGKRALLECYCEEVKHTVSGVRKKVSLDILIDSLSHKAGWLKDHIRKTEWLEEGWFNSYYDNHGQAVEGIRQGGVRMMLTGQVFTIMSGTAKEEQIRSIVGNADKYLFDEERGGYCLNTDFMELKTDLGRMFGFAYGHKENGAVFSHMTTMFGNALYARGFAREGYKALHTLYRQSMKTETSRIYPGIPEYFNDKGRGMYHYLTGAASWYLLTCVTLVFGVRGWYGDLCLAPKLLAEQFDDMGQAEVSLNFAGRSLTVVYHNPEKREYGTYKVGRCYLDGEEIMPVPAREEGDNELFVHELVNPAVRLPVGRILDLQPDTEHILKAELVERG